MSVVISTDIKARSLRVADFKTGDLLKEVIFKSDANALSLSDEGLIAVGTDHETLIVDTRRSFAVTASLQTGCVWALAFSISGTLVTGSYDGMLRVFSIPTFEVFSETRAHSDFVYALSFTPSNRHLLSASSNSTGVLLSYPSLTKIREFCLSGGGIFHTIFLSETMALLGTEDAMIRSWDISVSRDPVVICKEHAKTVTFFSISPDLSKYASGSEDALVKIFDARTFECIKTIKCTDSVLVVQFAGNDTLLVGVSRGMLVAVNIHTGDIIRNFGYHPDPSGILVSGAVCASK